MSSQTITMGAVYTALREALVGIDGLNDDTVFIGHIPDALPTYPGRPGWIRPYVVIWPLVPTPVDDRMVAGLQGRDAINFPFQTSMVAMDDVNELMPLMDAVTDVLTDLRIGGGSVYQQDTYVAGDGAPFELDPDLKDRYFTAIRWRIATQ